MGKISPVAAKYIVRAKFDAEGIVEKPDVVGAIFGQTEGLLGTELELRELQKNGRVGRIEINTTATGGKTTGTIEIPSSLDKTETAMIAAAVETIDRIGPCGANVTVENIEDVRIGKRDYILKRAKDLVRDMIGDVPDSGEMSENVGMAITTGKIQEWGPDKIPTGPTAESAEEIILVEGRADVISLLKAGYTNVVAVGGTKIPPSLAELVKGKKAIAFLDGDRGGDLILKELEAVTTIEFVARAPSGKEVEELNTKEVHKCLRAISPTDEEPKRTSRSRTNSRDRNLRGERGTRRTSSRGRPISRGRPSSRDRNSRDRGSRERTYSRKPRLDEAHKESFKNFVDELAGTKNAVLLDKNSEVLGKVPVTDLTNTLPEVKGIESIVVDGEIDRDIAGVADRARIKYVVGTSSSSRARYAKIISVEDLV